MPLDQRFTKINLLLFRVVHVPCKGGFFVSNEQVLTLEQAIEYILEVKIEHGVSNLSLKGYRDHWKAFRLFLEREDTLYVRDVNGSHMRRFIDSERQRDLAQTSLNNHIRYIRASFNILIEEGLYLEENPAHSVKLGKESKTSIFPIPPEILTRILDQPNHSKFLEKRNYVIMLMILDNGIRPSELLQGVMSDWAENYYTVREEVSKTGETRILPLSMETRKHLHQYIRLKGDWGNDLLFPSQSGESFNTDGFRRSLRKICKRAGLSAEESQGVHPYAFRHTFAYNYLEAGGNLFKLQDILGHTDLAMTRRYVKLLGTDLLNAHKTVRPLQKYLKTSKRRRRI